MSHKGSGSRIRKTGDHACGLPEDGEGIDGLLMGVAGVVLAVHRQDDVTGSQLSYNKKTE